MWWLAASGDSFSPHLPCLAKGFIFMERSGKGCPSWFLVLWVGRAGRGVLSGRSQEPSFLPPHQGRPCHQERDDPPMSESSFHLQLGANPIAGSNLIPH